MVTATQEAKKPTPKREVPLYQDPFHPVLLNSPTLNVSAEQDMYLMKILDVCCSDSRFAQKAYDAIKFLLSQIEIPIVPVLSALAPANGVIPLAAFTLTVTGTGFAPLSQIMWNGMPLTSTFVSDTELSALVDLSSATLPADYQVSVVNPGELTSNILTFSLTDVVLQSASAPVKKHEPVTHTPVTYTPVVHKGEEPVVKREEKK